MAYSSSTLYSGGSGFTSSCLDDIPFKLGPKFRPPSKVTLPPGVDLTRPSQSSALNGEYTFEVEEAVLKWSAERERQIEEQLRFERERQAALQQAAINSDSTSDAEAEDSNTQPDYENQVRRGEHTYENVNSRPIPKPRPNTNQPKSDYTNVTIPNPFIGNISNAILKPTPISNNGDANNGNGSKVADSTTKQFDVSLFEQEDDPFDNLELQTINDMEELASVLHETTKNSPVPMLNGTKVTNNSSDVGSAVNGTPAVPGTDDGVPVYENVPPKVNRNGPLPGEQVAEMPVDVSKLPPVPVRRDLVGRSQPLPPIGQSVDTVPSCLYQNEGNSGGKYDSNQTRQSLDMGAINRVLNSQLYDNVGHSHSQSASDNDNCIPERTPVIKDKAPGKPPRTMKYSRHDIEGDTTNPALEGGQVNIRNLSGGVGNADNLNVQFKNTISSPDVHEPSSGENLNFVSNHYGRDGVAPPTSSVGEDVAGSRPVPAPRRVPSPPSRPSSQQFPTREPLSAPQDNSPSWNRYTPLPPTSPRQQEEPSVCPAPQPVIPPVMSPPKPPSPTEINYNKFSNEARTSVDNLVNMGFAKGRVVRAVEKLGQDEKEVVEYLCLVDQLTEKGYKTSQVENALLLFQNSMNKASMYLELFTQMQELGFNGDKIKEALVNTNNDREKTLDILMASS